MGVTVATRSIHMWARHGSIPTCVHRAAWMNAAIPRGHQGHPGPPMGRKLDNRLDDPPDAATLSLNDSVIMKVMLMRMIVMLATRMVVMMMVTTAVMQVTTDR